MKNKRAFLKNEYIYSLIIKGCMVIVGLLESVLLARYLGAELRGNLSYIYSLSSTIYLILTFGIYTIYPFLRKKSEQPVQNIINEFMTITSVIFIFYFIVCMCCGFYIYKFSEITSLILFMIPFMGYDKISSFVFMIENPNRTNYISLLANIIQCLFLVFCMLFFTKSLIAGCCFYILGCTIKSIYCTYKLNCKLNLKLFSFSLLWNYIKFGFFPMIALLLTTLNYRLDVIMLGQYSYISLSQIGIYSIGIGLSEKSLLVPDTIKEVLLSKLAKGKGENEVAKVMRLCFAASILTAVFIQLLGEIIIEVLYGKEYSGAEMVTYISVWGTVFMVFFKMISQYNVIQHKQHLNVIFLLVSIIVNFFVNLLLIPYFGISGAAVATVIGYIISSIIFLIYFKKVSGIPIRKMMIPQKEDVIFLKKIR